MTTTQRLATEIKATLEKTGLPHHEITCFGRQIYVDCIGRETCVRWANVLGKFAKVQKMTDTLAYVGDSASSGNPKTFTIWRVWATIQ
jgi:hypothetical protein